MSILVFEDGQVENLYPITIGRPACAISCAGYRLVDWIERLQLPARAVLRPYLAEIFAIDYPMLSAPPAAGPHLLINARLVPSVANDHALRAMLNGGQAGLVKHNGATAAALLPPDAPPPPVDLKTDQLDDYFNYAGVPGLPELPHTLPLFDYPHDVVRYNLETFSANIAHRLEQGGYREVADGVFAADGAVLGEYVVSDTSNGPILLDRGAKIGPYCYLSGPAYIGPGTRVIEHSAIKDAVSLGHTTKIGGEVEASVVEPYSNKQHHGFLGHSYLGSWINLGAGTCNSDLKNTYGAVKMDYHGEKIATGMQFVGCIMGDYSKSAINTGIFTGKTVGACSMVYGFVTTNVPSFVNYARLFGQVTELPPEVMIATQQRMFARRNVEQRPCDVQLIHDMYQLTRDERQLAGEPLSL
ncbi:MAG: putative sugar nucleotidyl transferase [Pirellulaceae bacterium]